MSAMPHQEAVLGRTPESGDVLDTAQLEQLAAARKRARKVMKTARVAAFSGWTTAFFAACSLLGGLFSTTSLFLGLAIGVIAYVEIIGAARVRQFESAAARMLALNQIGFAAVLIIYALMSIYGTLNGPSPLAEISSATPEAQGMLGGFEDMYRMIALGVYGGLIVGTLLFQGGMALYYHRRQRIIEAYIQDTPGWIVELQRRL